jgi:hypothetical protein
MGKESVHEEQEQTDPEVVGMDEKPLGEFPLLV